MTGQRPETTAEPPLDPPFDPDALRYARYWEPVLSPAAQRVLDRLPEPPTVLLDLGAGTGSLTLAAAARWPAASLIALDASGAMLALARARAAAGDHDPARFRWVVADALAMPIDDASVDAVVSSFGPLRAGERPTLAEVHRVLRPGGRFAFVAWRGDELQPAADAAYADVLTELGHEPDVGGTRSPLEPDESSLHEARADLHAAGFDEIEVWPEELHAQWTPRTYLELRERYDDHERFDALDRPERERLRRRLRARLAELPQHAFAMRYPLLAGAARRNAA